MELLKKSSYKLNQGNKYSRTVMDRKSMASHARNRQRNNGYTEKKGIKKYFSIGMGLDLPFCLLILVLLAIGLVMMFSASFPVALYEYGDSYYYLKKQLVFILMGLAVMFFVSYFDYHLLHKLSPVILGVSYVALVVVLLIPSETGVHRWIGIGGFGIQASEISKFALILFMAHWGSLYYDKMKSFKYGILPAMIIFVTTEFLLIREPHYSCMVIVAVLTILMMFISGIDIKWIMILGCVLLVAILILWVTGLLTYAMSRMEGWGQALVYTTSKMWQDTWQTRNSIYAIGSGGLFGLGLGQSRQKYLYLPEPQNDFIFAVICEELGFVGALIILLIFALLVWRGIVLSLRVPDRFGKLLGVGLSAQIGLQVVLNILVITDWLPNTGISLPFFSYGGSSMLMLLFQMGIVLSISRSSNIEKA